MFGQNENYAEILDLQKNPAQSCEFSGTIRVYHREVHTMNHEAVWVAQPQFDFCVA